MTASRDRIYFLDEGYISTSPQNVSRCSGRYGATILVAVERELCRLDTIDGRRAFEALAIGPGAGDNRSLDPSGVVRFCINPSNRWFRRFSGIGAGGVLALDRSIFSAFDVSINAAHRGELTLREGYELFGAVIGAAVPHLPRVRPADRRVKKLLQRLHDDPDCRLEDLGTLLGLSRFRISHLFSESVGLPFKTYRFWLKLHKAALLMQSGHALAEIVDTCGFTDLCHLSRAFREVFGVTPSRVVAAKGAATSYWWMSRAQAGDSDSASLLSASFSRT